MLKTIKIPTIAGTCFGSRRDHHQGPISCLAKATIMILLCSSLMTWSMLCGIPGCCASMRYTVEKHMLHILAQQAKICNIYKNTRLKLLKTNAALWFNKMCKTKNLKPKRVPSSTVYRMLAQQAGMPP